MAKENNANEDKSDDRNDEDNYDDKLSTEDDERKVDDERGEDDEREENGEHKEDDERGENGNRGEDNEKTIKLLPTDYDQNMDDDVDTAQFRQKCPSVCPHRDVMVCAKCEHNVYRSFLSVCHLRAFSCQHPKEKLELVKRGPCVQSAPFITGLPKSRGSVVEPNDEDIVLKFINCRQYGKLDTNDPRCKFGNETIKDSQ